MAGSEPKDHPKQKAARKMGGSVQDMLELHEQLLGRLGLVPGTPALDSHRELVVKTNSGESAEEEIADERES